MSKQTIEELRRTQLEIAEAIAPGWERRREFVEQTTTAVREWLVRELDAQSGETVLELACGAGDTGFEVAEIIGEGGPVGRRRGQTQLGSYEQEGL